MAREELPKSHVPFPNFITDKWTDRPPDRPCVLKDVGFDG
jgi:hypothetical protein